MLVMAHENKMSDLLKFWDDMLKMGAGSKLVLKKIPAKVTDKYFFVVETCCLVSSSHHVLASVHCTTLFIVS